MEKKSLLQKIMDRLKNTALFNIFLNPDAGTVIPSEDIDSDDRITQLANSSGISEREMASIDRVFNEAEFSLDGIQKEITKIPEEKKESINPFKVDESELNHEEIELAPRTQGQEREIDD